MDIKIREAQLEKTPYMLVLGESEKEDRNVSIRKRGEGDLGAMSLELFIAQLKEELRSAH
ncbi:hypothetical protein MU1_33680 [Paenibacillus glycanilyticus]|uniref:Anticodon-binding domain-containing protein n=1 Tax=Paenibacillus glycanilyticus TaxID=126569 RepID=A0ABQ6GFN5_9BACL|nr:hypothetical protein MU1_33680 [Paenibacillus glycanilyticus]